MTWGIFKKDSISATFEKLQEEQKKAEGSVYKVYSNAHPDPEHHTVHKSLESAKKEYAKHSKTGGAMYHGDKLYNKKTDKFESVEVTGQQLDELKKSTLSSYVKKASDDRADTGYHTGYWDRAHGGSKPEYQSQAEKEHGQEKRKAGIHKALHRLTKEDVTEQELNTMVSEVLSVDQGAGKWISDFVKSDNPKFAGKSPEKRKQMALAAYYAAQKNESTDYESFLVLDEATQGEIVKMGAKEIKHANMKDKQDEADVMEPHSEGEADFLDKHSVNVTDDPTQGKLDAGKVPTAAKPAGKGAGNYDGNSKLSDKDKASYKESVEAEDIIEDCITEEAACSSSKKGGKKTFSQFKKEMK